jgi:hypothetical protein
MIDSLIKLGGEGFMSVKDHWKYNSTYSLEDLLSAGFAVFSLKDPSLLAFRQQFPRRSEITALSIFRKIPRYGKGSMGLIRRYYKGSSSL